jgi:hypothetical protein
MANIVNFEHFLLKISKEKCGFSEKSALEEVNAENRFKIGKKLKPQ